MNVAVKSIGMFNKLNIPIIGVIENMSYLDCPNCHEKINIFGKGGGQKISEQFNIPFIGEIPLTPQIMQGSDSGKSIIISEPESEYSQAFYKIAGIAAGRISVVAIDLKDQEEKEAANKEKIPQ
jgi:ATP-binding protein involved in chromosome partitioning